MTSKSRPSDMSDIEWLVALEDIRQLKARRDRYVDAHDWAGYEALHAPDHVSHHSADPKNGIPASAWNSAAEMVANVSKIMSGELNNVTVHHSYDPEIVLTRRSKREAFGR